MPSPLIKVKLVIMLFYRWVLPESPRWLLAMGQTDRVLKILQKAAKHNRRELPRNLNKQIIPIEKSNNGESVNVLDLFKTKQIRKKTLLLFVIWFSVYLVYYGLVLNLGNIGGNLYINSVYLPYTLTYTTKNNFF